jgi:hypothetical protein
VDKSNELAGADALPDGEVWAVGVDSDTQNGTYSKTLILRACT